MVALLWLSLAVPAAGAALVVLVPRRAAGLVATLEIGRVHV